MYSLLIKVECMAGAYREIVVALNSVCEQVSAISCHLETGRSQEEDMEPNQAALPHDNSSDRVAQRILYHIMQTST